MSGNSADDNGGGIWASRHANLTLTNSTVSGNWRGLQRRRDSVRGGTTTLTNSTVSGNYGTEQFRRHLG